MAESRYEDISYASPPDTTEDVVELADFETAIWETGFGKFNYFIFFAMIPVTLSFVFNTSAMSFIIPVVSCDFQLSSLQKGVLNGAIYAGMIPSGLLWGFVTDLRGRQKVLFWGLLADVTAGLLTSLAPNFAMLVFCRFMAGIAMCATYASSYTLLVEFLVMSRRDAGVMLLGCFTSSANFVQPLLAYLIIPMPFEYPISHTYLFTSWRLFLLVCNLPSFLGAIFFFFIPESPKFLMTMGRSEEALQVFRTIYARNTGKPKDSYPVKSLMPGLPREATSNHSLGAKLRKGWQITGPLFKPPLVKTALVIFFLQTFCLMSMNVVRLLQPEILSKHFRENDPSLSLCQSISRGSSKKSLDTKSFQFYGTHPDGKEYHWRAMRSLESWSPAVGFSTDIGLFTAKETNSAQARFILQSSKKGLSAEDRHKKCMQEFPVDIRIYSLSTFVGVFSFLYYIMTVFLVRGLGKKELFLFAMVICTLCVGTYPFSTSVYVVLLPGIFMAFIFTTNNLVLGCSLQAFPTTSRAMAVNLTMMCGRTGTLVGSILFPKYIEKECTMAFLTLTGFMIMCFLVCLIFLKEVAYEEKSISRPMSMEEMAEERPMSHSMYMIHS